MKATGIACAAMLAVAAIFAPGARADQPLGFYVLNQRTIALAAQYWNPILTHVRKKSGVSLDLKLGGTADLGLLPRVGHLERLEIWRIRGLADVSAIGDVTTLRWLFL